MASIFISMILASLAICLHSVSGIEYNTNPYTSHGSSGFSQALDYSNSIDYGDYGGLIGGGNVGSGANDLDETSQYLNVLGKYLITVAILYNVKYILTNKINFLIFKNWPKSILIIINP